MVKLLQINIFQSVPFSVLEMLRWMRSILSCVASFQERVEPIAVQTLYKVLKMVPNVMKNIKILSISAILQSSNHLLTAQIKYKNLRNILPISSLHSLSISLHIYKVTTIITLTITDATLLYTPGTGLFPDHVPTGLGTWRHFIITVQELFNDALNFHMDPTNPALSMNLFIGPCGDVPHIHSYFQYPFLFIHLQAFYIVIQHITLISKTSHIPSLILIQIQLLQDTSPSTPVTCHPS